MSNNQYDFQNFLDEFRLLQKNLLTMPEEEALSENFANEQQKLSQLLTRLTSFPPQEQEIAKSEMRDFAEKLSHKLYSLKRRMEQLSTDMSSVENRTRGIKAYTQGKIF